MDNFIFVYISINMKRKTRKNFKNQKSNYISEKGKSLEECELEILRNAVDKAEKKQGN